MKVSDFLDKLPTLHPLPFWKQGQRGGGRGGGRGQGGEEGTGGRIQHSEMLHLQLLFNKDGDMAVVEEEKKVDNEVAGGLDVLGW